MKITKKFKLLVNKYIYVWENSRSWWNGLQINLELIFPSSPYCLIANGTVGFRLLLSMAFIMQSVHSLTRDLISATLGMVALENGVRWRLKECKGIPVWTKLKKISHQYRKRLGTSDIFMLSQHIPMNQCYKRNEISLFFTFLNFIKFTIDIWLMVITLISLALSQQSAPQTKQHKLHPWTEYTTIDLIPIHRYESSQPL